MPVIVYVENGLAGCRLAVERDTVTVVVDALRASANIVSMFHYGTREVLVVEQVEQAFAERQRRPGALLVGERGGPMVPGFDLGNSPLQEPPSRDITSVVFSSSNCSRCCVGAAPCPLTLLGSTVNASAVAAQVVAEAQGRGKQEVVFITAGAAEDEVRLTIEDHLAVGAIMAHLSDVTPGNDRARVCEVLVQDAEQEALTAGFCNSDNGRRLTQIGLGEDVRFAARLDAFGLVPRVAGTVDLLDGGVGALLRGG